MKWTSIRTRLTVWSMGVQALIMVIMGLVLWTTVRVSLLSSVDREMEARANTMLTRRPPFGRTRRPHRFPPPPPPLVRPAMPTSSFIRFRPRLLGLNSKSLLPDVVGGPWDVSSFAPSVQGRTVFTTIRTQGEPVRILSTPIRRDGQIVGVLQMAYSLQEVDRDLGALTRALLMLIPVALLVTGFSGAFQTDRMLRPVRQITHTAARIGADDLSNRLPVAGEDEFSDLTRTFNAMLARLEQGFEQQRRFTADASHELRTPLTAIKAHTSLALSGEKSTAEYRTALEGANRAATVMAHIVQDLLFLARVESHKDRSTFVPVALHEVFAVAIEMIGQCDHAPISLEMADPDIRIMGDSAQLIRLFTNLLDNAVRHTPVDGQIVLRAGSPGLNVHIQVTDTGTGIAPEHLPHVCERFYRVDASRSRKAGGTGLGLAISQSIVEAHGGKLAIESTLGSGTTVRVVIPRIPPTHS